MLFICHESEHFPKALFKSDGHLAGPGIVIVVEEAVSVLCFLLHCCTAVHPTYARDLTIGWTGEKWRVGSKQMVALYKTAGRDVQMLSFEGAASTTPTYLPPDFSGPFHNLGDLTPPSWGWCVCLKFWGRSWNNGTRQSHYMTWKAVCWTFVISQYLGVPSFHPLVGWVWCAEQDGDGGQPQQDAEGDDEQAADEWDRGWGCGEDQLGHKIVVNTSRSKNEWLSWLTPRWGRIGTHLSTWIAISAQFDQGLSINNQPQTPFSET